MPQKDLYLILGVPAQATPEQIRTAYRRRLKRYHPDLYRGDPDVGAANARELVEAYDTLIDPARRAEYDAGRAEEVLRFERRPHASTVVKIRARGSTDPGGGRSDGTDTTGPDDAAPTGAPAPVPLWLMREWRDSGHRERERFVVPKRLQVAFFLFFVGLILFIAVALTLPYTHDFTLSATFEGAPAYAEVCGDSENLPIGTNVAFTWQAHGYGPANASEPAPTIVVVDANGNLVAELQAWNGASSFLSQGGSYEFGIAYCGLSADAYTAQFSGQFSAPLFYVS